MLESKVEGSLMETRGRPPIHSDEVIAEQLKKYRGNCAAVARAIHVNRTGVWARVKKSEVLSAIVDSEREGMIDDAENILYEQVLAGNITALIFFLKTQGHKRGYGRQAHYDPDNPEESGNKIVIVDRRGEISEAGKLIIDDGPGTTE